MGASGPKDVILIIDKSGSMQRESRMGYAKDAAIGVVNSLTNVDYVSVVTFSTAASSENSMIVQAGGVPPLVMPWHIRIASLSH
jgi:secreted protein with Ig-like and vWFA domain